MVYSEVNEEIIAAYLAITGKSGDLSAWMNRFDRTTPKDVFCNCDIKFLI